MKPNYQAAKKCAFNLLKQLPDYFTHHNIVHTKRVLNACIELGKLEDINENKQLLINTAGLYHDLGYLERYINNEKIGAKIASNILPLFNYSKNQINQIEQMIMATRLNYDNSKIIQSASPNNILEKIICDADLYHLGHPNFLKERDRLRTELKAFGGKISKNEWLHQQLSFLEGHEYLTYSAKLLKKPQKEINRLEIIKLIEQSKNIHH